MPFLWTILRYFFNLHSFYVPSTPKPFLPAAGLGAAYGHNSRHVNHNTTISRGSRTVEFGDDFTLLGSEEDIGKYHHVPLKIYRRQEVHVTSEVEEPGLEPRMSDDGASSSRPSKDHATFKV
jgi:hypothetical protein